MTIMDQSNSNDIIMNQSYCNDIIMNQSNCNDIIMNQSKTRADHIYRNEDVEKKEKRGGAKKVGEEHWGMGKTPINFQKHLSTPNKNHISFGFGFPFD